MGATASDVASSAASSSSEDLYNTTEFTEQLPNMRQLGVCMQSSFILILESSMMSFFRGKIVESAMSRVCKWGEEVGDSLGESVTELTNMYNQSKDSRCVPDAGFEDAEFLLTALQFMMKTIQKVEHTVKDNRSQGVQNAVQDPQVINKMTTIVLTTFHFISIRMNVFGDNEPNATKAAIKLAEPVLEALMDSLIQSSWQGVIAHLANVMATKLDGAAAKSYEKMISKIMKNTAVLALESLFINVEGERLQDVYAVFAIHDLDTCNRIKTCTTTAYATAGE